MGLGAPAGTAPAAPSVTDTDPNADQSQDQGQQPGTGAAAPAGKVLVDANFERAFTQKSQTIAALAKELGISRDASIEDFRQAIEARTAAPAAVDEDETPEVAKRRRELDQRAWDLAEERYGSEMTSRAKEFFEGQRNRRDPFQSVAAFNAAVMEAAQQLAQGANPGQGQAQPAGQQQGGEGFPELGETRQGSTPQTRPNPADYKGDPEGFASALGSFLRRSR